MLGFSEIRSKKNKGLEMFLLLFLFYQRGFNSEYKIKISLEDNFVNYNLKEFKTDMILF